MNFPVGKTLALIYRHPEYGTPDYLHEARQAVLLDAHEQGVEPRIIRREFVEFNNGFRVVFLDEDRQEMQSRGYRFDAAHCVGQATYISETVERACYSKPLRQNSR